MISELTLIVPFCVPAGEIAEDAWRELTLPGLASLLAQARAIERERRDDADLPTLPHERWLAQCAGLPAAPLPAAPYMRAADGGGADTRVWACLQPVHLHAARDHLVMRDPAQLALKTAEAQALRQAIAPLIAERGLALEAPCAARWYLADAPFGALHAASPRRIAGHNLAAWMHQGECARAWRAFQNEIQMIWHHHPVNQARATQGLPPVNSVWLFGQGALQDTRLIAACMIGDDPFFAGLARTGNATRLTAHAFAALPQDGARAAVLLDAAAAPFLSGNGYGWTFALRALDRDWFSPAASALADGRIDAISLILAGVSHYAHYRATRRSRTSQALGWLRRIVNASQPRSLREMLSVL